MLSAFTLFMFCIQWYRARSYRVYAKADLPVISLDKEKHSIVVTVVNSGERQFSIDAIGIWVHARNSIGQVFDISLTEIGKAKLEDGDKVRKSLDVGKYLDELVDYRHQYFTRFDRWLPNRIEMYFTTTTKKKIPIKLSIEAKQKIVEYIVRDNELV